MKNLNILRKIHKYKLDDLSKRVFNLERDLKTTKKKLSNIIETKKNEIEKYNGTEFAFSIDAYIKQIDKEEIATKLHIDRLENLIQETTNEIQKEFSELKKIEHLICLNKAKEIQGMNKKESAKLDELTIIKYVHRQKSETLN